MEKEVIVVGAGLAGSEAAYQLAKRGIKVSLQQSLLFIFIYFFNIFTFRIASTS